MADESPTVNDRRRTYIIEARKKRGWSQMTLAKRVGCSQNEISKIETGERERIGPELIQKIAGQLGMDPAEVVFGNPKKRSIKVLGDIRGNEEVSMYTDAEDLEIGWLADDNMESYRIAADTLWPRFNEGDLLLCRPTNTPLADCYGRECVVEFEGRRYVKHVETGATVRLVTLRSYRAANPTLVDVKPLWIAPIVAIVCGVPLRPPHEPASLP